LKGHSIILAKKPPDADRLDAQPAKITIRQPVWSILVDMMQKPAHPSRLPAIGIKRPTPAARPKTRVHRFTWSAEELSVPRQGWPGRTGRPAEYSRRLHAGEKNAVEARIAMP
jgi:hypothetical protein